MNRIKSTGCRVFCSVLLFLVGAIPGRAQVNTDQVMRIGQNTLYFDDYVLSIQYFNQAIAAKPWLARPYFLRAIAKLNLDDWAGAEADATAAIERNPWIDEAYEVRAMARQSIGNISGAIDDYDRALEHNPTRPGLLYNKALAWAQRRDYRSADSIFSVLVSTNPSYDIAWSARARTRLVLADTASARADVDQALKLNPRSVNALLLRADIAATADHDDSLALVSVDEALRIEPRNTSLYITRAYLRYRTLDYHGAMADYDYAIQLDPLSTTALFNRAIMRSEVGDNNRALADLDRILTIDPDDFRALFNRALLRQELGDIDGAMADIDRLIEEFPTFAAPWYLRYELRRMKGDRRADDDRMHSLALAEQPVPVAFRPASADDEDIEDEQPEMSQEEVKRRFTSIISMGALADAADADLGTPTSPTSIKGRVQDRGARAELEPPFMLTYYLPTTELKPAGDWVREVTTLNEMRLLPWVVQVSNRASDMSTDQSTFDAHNKSADRLSALIAAAGDKPRAVDYFARAMDRFTLRDYEGAIEDATAALRLTPDFTLAYILRFDARWMEQSGVWRVEGGVGFAAIDDGDNSTLHTPHSTLQFMLADLDEAIRLSPGMAMAWYNKGVLLATAGDYQGAVDAFTRAIGLRPDMGEAYYNRGFAHLQMGHRDRGTSDLSVAGQLGIVPSYALLKSLSK